MKTPVRMPVHRSVLIAAVAACLVVITAGGAGAADAGGPVPPPDGLVPPTDEVPTDDVAPPGSQDRSRGHVQPAAAGEELVGTFRLTAGSCTSDGATGTWFRMERDGQGVSNNDSPCDDGTYTPLEPGTDAGLVTDEYQPQPDPAFDADGNALADRLTRPTGFFGTDFSTSTNPVDPQTGTEVPAPRVVHDGDGALSGDLRAFAAAWNNQHFNQGSPKPDGSTPGTTTPVSGTYDPETGAFTLSWRSHIVGGPFDGFTGMWHLQGIFEPTDARVASSPAGPDDEDPSGVDQDPSSTPDGSATPESDAGGPTSDTAAGERELARTGPLAPPVIGLALLFGARLVRGRRP